MDALVFTERLAVITGWFIQTFGAVLTHRFSRQIKSGSDGDGNPGY